MTFARKVAGALSFAHLAGLGRGKAKAADDENDKDRDHEDVTDGAKKGKKAEAEGPDDDDKDNKDGGARGENDDGDSRADGGADSDRNDGDGDEKDDKKSKKAAADDGDGDPDDEMRGNSAAAQARRREQARCAAIFASPAAARNPVLAANLAFKTRQSRAEALAVLEGTPGAVNTNADRQLRNPRVGAAGAAGLTSKQAVDQSWDRAFASASPQRKR
jgi:hypothetical protein